LDAGIRDRPHVYPVFYRFRCAALVLFLRLTYLDREMGLPALRVPQKGAAGQPVMAEKM